MKNKRRWNNGFIKIFKKFLENFWNAFNSLWNKSYFDLVCKFQIWNNWNKVLCSSSYFIDSRIFRKLLPQLDLGFKRTINWNKHLSKPELLAENTNLNHLVEPCFQGVNEIFVLAFESDAQRKAMQDIIFQM